MLNDDILTNFGQKMLKNRQVKGELVVGKGEGDGFFYDPINKFMIRVQRGRDYCLIKEDYDERGRILLYDYTHNFCFLVDKQDCIAVETN